MGGGNQRIQFEQFPVFQKVLVGCRPKLKCAKQDTAKKKKKRKERKNFDEKNDGNGIGRLLKVTQNKRRPGVNTFPPPMPAFPFTSPPRTFNWIFQFKLKLIFTLSISIYTAIYTHIHIFWIGISLLRATQNAKKKRKIDNVAGKPRAEIVLMSWN